MGACVYSFYCGAAEDEDAAAAVSGIASVISSEVKPEVGSAGAGGLIFVNSSMVKANVNMATIMPQRIRIAFFRGFWDDLFFI